MANSQKDKPGSEESWAKRLQLIIKRRRLAVYMIIGGFLILLVVYNFGNFLFLQQMQQEFESELELRLISISTLSANLVEKNLQQSFSEFGLEDQITQLIIQDQLINIKRMHQLEGLFIIDENYRTKIDSYENLEFSISHSYLREDSTTIKRAWEGIPAASAVHTLNDQRFMSAYAPVRNDNGLVIGVLVTEANAYFFDILERYRNTFLITATVSIGVFVLFTTFILYALRLLIQTQESLSKSERLAMMGQMSAVLAHEIRNPLGIIRGTADVLKSRYQNKKHPDQLFHYIPDEVSRLNKLVNDFLILSKDSNLNFEKNDINNLIAETIEKMKLNDEKKNVEFQLEVSPLEAFLFDRSAVQQVLINLLRNSMQALQEGGEITIKTLKLDIQGTPYSQVQIIDSGSGIEDVENIFEPFYTTKSSGSGLGMPVSKKIIESHGGYITVDSQVGNGTTVTIQLPIEGNI